MKQIIKFAKKVSSNFFFSNNFSPSYTTLLKVAIAFFLLLLLFALPNLICEGFHVGARKARDDSSSQKAILSIGKLCPTEGGCVNAVFYDGGMGQFTKPLVEQAVNASSAQWVCLSSLGGDTDSGKALGRYLAEHSIGACVVPRRNEKGEDISTLCASSCVFAWVGATKRAFAAEKASIGIHDGWIGEGKSCVLANYLASVNVKRQNSIDYTSLNDSDRRLSFFQKGYGCGPTELYYLDRASPEAATFITDAKLQYWVADDDKSQYRKAPELKTCGKSV